MRKKFVQLIFIFGALALLFLFPPTLEAFMSSTNYRLWADESNDAGGGTATSSSYSMDFTVGETAIGNSSSTNYNLSAGFQEMTEWPIFRFQLSKNYVAFGVLDNGFVYQDSITATTTANSLFGYTTSLYQNGPLTTGVHNFAAVGDGSITNGQEEYGVNATGADVVTTGDVALADTPLDISSFGGYYSTQTYADDRQTTVTFKISKAPTTPAGDYNQQVYFISTGNF